MIKLSNILEYEKPKKKNLKLVDDYDFYQLMNDTVYEELQDFLTHEYVYSHKEQEWKVAPYTTVKRVWEDFMKYGFVRDEKKLEEIISIFLKNIARLYANTYLSGHTSSSPDEDFMGVGYTEEDKEHFWDWIGDKLSDYGLEPLIKLGVKMVKEKVPEKRILIADEMLNIIHQRSDLSAMFVYGGKSSLDDLAGGAKEPKRNSFIESLQKEFVEGFDMDKFKSMRTFAERSRYCNSILPRMASGTEREIFRIDDERVLKLAKNVKGIAQNKVESDYLLNDWYCDIIAKVLESDNDNRWVVSEFAKKITPSRFKQLLGVSINEFWAYLSNVVGKVHFHIPSEITEMLNENEFAGQLVDMIGNFDLEIGDFQRISTFGEIDGRLVITDYGLSKNVYNTYYNKENTMKLKPLIYEFVMSNKLEEFLENFKREHPNATAEEISDAVIDFLSEGGHITESIATSILKYAIPAIMMVYGSNPVFAKDVAKKVSAKAKTTQIMKKKKAVKSVSMHISGAKVMVWIKEYAKQYRIPENALLRLVRRETSFSPSKKQYQYNIIGDRGNVLGPSYGPCQVKVPVAQEIYDNEPEEDVDKISAGKLLTDPKFNIRTAAKILGHYYHKKFSKVKNGRERLAYAATAYNAGLTGVRNYGISSYGKTVAGM